VVAPVTPARCSAVLAAELLAGEFHAELNKEATTVPQSATTVPQSVLEAIRMGVWDFEPEQEQVLQFSSTRALPGTSEKLDVLAERLEQGLPLWHPDDRRTYDDAAD
jgi:hypothetical protein